MYKLDKSDLLKLLNNAEKNEQSVRSESRKILSTYSSILVAVLGGSLLGLQYLKDSKILGSFFIVVAGIVVLLFSYSGYRHFRSDFKRQVEYMIIQSKLEDILGLTDKKELHAKNYWKNEAIVPNTYMRYRETYRDNSEDFLAEMLKSKDVRVVRIYFGAYACIGALFVVLGLLIAVGLISGAMVPVV